MGCASLFPPFCREGGTSSERLFSSPLLSSPALRLPQVVHVQLNVSSCFRLSSSSAPAGEEEVGAGAEEEEEKEEGKGLDPSLLLQQHQDAKAGSSALLPPDATLDAIRRYGTTWLVPARTDALEARLLPGVGGGGGDGANVALMLVSADAAVNRTVCQAQVLEQVHCVVGPAFADKCPPRPAA